MKKAVLLTLWLLLPMTVVGGLMAWVFISMDKDKPMMDLPALGAGGGDTGGVNAIGEMLHGNDPDAIQHAKRAQQEQIPMDPRDWPGGVELLINFKMVGKVQQDFEIELQGGKTREAIGVRGDSYADEFYSVRLTHEQIRDAKIKLPDWDGWYVISEQIPPRDLSKSDPWVIEVWNDSVYEESP